MVCRIEARHDHHVTVESPAAKKAFNAAEIRILIAKHLDVDIERVTDDANFIHDLGADWLDRLELMILIEEFGGLEITDDCGGDSSRWRSHRYIEDRGINGQKR